MLVTALNTDPCLCLCPFVCHAALPVAAHGLMPALAAGEAQARKACMLARRSQEAQALLVRGKRARKPSAKVGGPSSQPSSGPALA